MNIWSRTPVKHRGDTWFVLRVWWLNEARTRVVAVNRAAWRSVSQALWNAQAVTAVRAEVVKVVDGIDVATVWTNGIEE